MGNMMSRNSYIERIDDCMKTLRAIADSKVLGDGTNETWACGITASHLLPDLRRSVERRHNPQPLTWEELSDMVGEPVWTMGENCGLAGWDIIEEVYEDSVLFGRSTEQPEKWRYNLRELNGELSACAWLAYRNKPEGSAE